MTLLPEREVLAKYLALQDQYARGELSGAEFRKWAHRIASQGERTENVIAIERSTR